MGIMNIIQDLFSKLRSQNNALANKTGLENDKTQAILNLVVPLLLKKISQNASNETGSKALESALSKDHDGSILEDLVSAITNPDTKNGDGILEHVLSHQKSDIIDKLASQTNAKSDQVASIMTIVAPIIMGELGKKQKATSDSSITSILTSLIDKNDDRSAVDDLLQMGINWLGKKG